MFSNILEDITKLCLIIPRQVLLNWCLILPMKVLLNWLFSNTNKGIIKLLIKSIVFQKRLKPRQFFQGHRLLAFILLPRLFIFVHSLSSTSRDQLFFVDFFGRVACKEPRTTFQIETSEWQEVTSLDIRPQVQRKRKQPRHQTGSTETA